MINNAKVLSVISKYPNHVQVTARKILDLGVIQDLWNDDNHSICFSFSKEPFGSYGLKLTSDNKLSGIQFVMDFWEVTIPMEDLLNKVSPKTAEAIIFNLDLFTNQDKELIH